MLRSTARAIFLWGKHVAAFTDLGLAFRAMHRRPALSAAIVVPVSLAIAINCALFSVMDGLLFRPLPFRSPAELVAIEYRWVAGELPELAYASALESERQRLRIGLETAPLVATAAHASHTALLGPGPREAGIQTTAIDSRFFPLLGLAPVLGSGFTSDDELGAVPVSTDVAIPVPVIISHRLWLGMFGGDPRVLGVREVAGASVRVVGVMGPGVKFPGETDIWVAVRPPNRPPAYARLAPGATVEQLSARFPMLGITSLADAIRPESGRTLIVLFGAAGVLLLVAWVQVAALVFSGAIGRIHEMGVRLGLGAGRIALVRQLAIENALLAGSALLLAWLTVHPLTALVVGTLPAELSAGQYLTPDARTFAFASAASIVGLALLTAVPFAAIGRASPLRLLQGQVGRLPFTAERLRRGLLTFQITLTAALLYVAGLMVHSFVQAASFDYGFDSQNVLLFTPPTPAVRGSAGLSAHDLVDVRLAEKQRRIAESLDALQRLPVVVAAAAFSSVPLVTQGSRLWTSVPGRPREIWEEVSEFDGRLVIPRFQARRNVVSSAFIRALGATLVVGRGFDDPEYLGREDVIIVNETLANHLAPAASANRELYMSVLGRTIRTTWWKGRIVGVVKNLVYSSPSDPAVPQFFGPTPSDAPYGVVVIRTSPSVERALPAIETTLRHVWGDVPPTHFALLRDAWHAGLAPFRGKAVLVGLIAAFCIPLAAVGLSGALLYSVQVRTRETAIRISLGADPRAVRRTVIRSALTTVAFGLIAGALLGVAAGRAAAHQLFLVHPIDAWTIVTVMLGLLGVAWLAALVPARRASRLEPATALRAE